MEFLGGMGEYMIYTTRYKNNNNLCICIEDFDGPYATLSVNTNNKLKDNEFVLNHNLFSSPMFCLFLNDLLNSGFFVDTGEVCDYGYYKCVPIWRVK